MARPWIDTHIHVSDIGPDGAKRENMLDDLLELVDRCDADLRLVISCDGAYNSMVKNDPDGMLKANSMVYNLVRQAPDRLHGSCIANPNFFDESLQVMDLCFGEWGFVQLGEMLQYMMDFRMDSDPTEQLVRKAVEYDVPVQVHLGTYCWPVRGYTAFDSADGIQHMADLLGIVRRCPAPFATCQRHVCSRERTGPRAKAPHFKPMELCSTFPSRRIPFPLA